MKNRNRETERQRDRKNERRGGWGGHGPDIRGEKKMHSGNERETIT